MQDLDKFKNEMNLSGQNVYVGHRYVPKIMGDWDNTKIYEPLSIVQYQGNSFTSRQFVPSGVELTNEDYWASTGNYNAQIEQYRQDVRNLESDFNNLDDEFNNFNNEFNNLNEEFNNVNNEFKEQLKQHSINITKLPTPYVSAKGDGVTDDTQAFISAHELLPEGGGKIFVPVGQFKISSLVEFTKPTLLVGAVTSQLEYLKGSTIRTTLNGMIKFSGPASGAEEINIVGDESHVAKANAQWTGSRPQARNVNSHHSGGDGLLIGDKDVAVNVNSFNMINLKAWDSKGHGLHIASKIGEAPNANAGLLMGFDGAGNLGDGIRLTNAHSSTFLGVHCESNLGVDSWGIRLVNGSAGNWFLNPYTEETVGDIYLTDDTFQNTFLGLRSGVGHTITDLGALNLIFHKEIAKAQVNVFEGDVYFKGVGVSNPNTAGVLKWYQDDDGHMKLEQKQTSVVKNVDITSTTNKRIFKTDKLNVGNTANNLTSIVRALGGFKFDTVLGQSSKIATKLLEGVKVGDVVAVSTNGTQTNNVSFTGFIAEEGVVSVRATNPTITPEELGILPLNCIIFRAE